MKKLLPFLLLFCLPALATEIISSARKVTWTNNVGIPGGIPDSFAMTTYATMGSTATLAQVSAKLTSCPSNQVVQLLAGTYSWSGDLDYQSIGDGKVLRGSTNANGWPTTLIRSANSLVLVRTVANESALSTDANLTADGNKGDTTITLSSVPSWVIVGDIIGIDQLDDTALSFNPGQEAGTSYREILGNGARGMAQLLKVTAKTSTTITFELPLAWTFSTAKTAQIFEPLRDPASYSPVRRIGFENFVFEHTGTANSDNHMFKFENAEQCWMKNVVGTNLVGGIYVFGIGSYRCEIRHCRFDNSKSLGGGQGYGVGLYHFCTGWLVEDNIFRKLHVGMQNNYGSCYNVFAYNFETDGQSDSGQNPGMSGHGTTGYMTLFEGNWCMDKWLGDFTHGAGCYYTVFRNRIVGKNPAETAEQTAFSNERYNRKLNCVGNLLGDASWHTVWMIAPSGSGYGQSTSTCDDHAIYKLGYWSNYGCDTTATDNAATMDPLFAVNYDVVTATNSGIVLGAYQTSDLGSSYYSASKPASFGGMPWPPYSPTSVTAAAMSATNIPAGYRYTFNVDTPASGGGDTTDPTITVTSPSDDPHDNGSTATAVVSGTASDDTAVTSVTYSSDKGDSGTATGTTSWTTVANLSSGQNNYTFTAHDAAGNTGTDTVRIDYTPGGTITINFGNITAGQVISTP